MEWLDQDFDNLPADATPEPASAQVLIIHSSHERVAAIESIVRDFGSECVVSPCIRDAESILLRDAPQVVVLEADDGSENDLIAIERVAQVCHGTKIVVVTDEPSLDFLISAMRLGVDDVLTDSSDTGGMREVIERAVEQSLTQSALHSRVQRLARMCHQLRLARSEINEQVDTLCNDLVAAYREIADQVSEAAMTSEFRVLLGQELDLEALLRTTLEYLLTKTGSTNAAVFLPSPGGEFGLGAYVNYDCPRESADVLLDYFAEEVCPMLAVDPDLVRFDDAGELIDWLGEEAPYLANSQVIAHSCMHDDDCLAVMMFFRDRSDPFPDELAAVLEALRLIFAEQVARVVRVHHRANPEWPDEATDSFGYDPADSFECEDEFDDYGFSGGLAA